MPKSLETTQSSVSKAGEIVFLKELLLQEDRDTILLRLSSEGYDLEGLFEKDLNEIRNIIFARIAEFEKPIDEAEGIELITKNIEARYERMKEVFAPILHRNDAPPFPTKEAVLNSVLKALTPEQLAYMLDPTRSPFQFQMKLVGSFELLKALLDGQPKTMNFGNRNQKDLCIDSGGEEHLTKNYPKDTLVEWKWSFYQGEQLAKAESWDDLDLTLEKRFKKFKSQLPPGMKGTDFANWAIRMAEGLEEGQPLDFHVQQGNLKNSFLITQKGTILDEEASYYSYERNRYLVGSFDSKERYAELNGYAVNISFNISSFRAAVDGPIND